MGKTAALVSAIALTFGFAALSGSALAGNGNGGSSEEHGNSANAPGQVKKAETNVASGGSVEQNANASVAGVKPTSSTAKGNHNTMCTTGGGTGTSATCASTGSNAATAQTAAHADASKRYGNGSTAAQIANANGAPSGTPVFGPGNSQPHKVTDCKHKHAVDVHAVKSYSTAACAETTSKTTLTKTPTTSNTVTTTAGATVVGTTAAGVPTTTGPAAGTPAPQQGGVLGATTSSKSGKPEGGVLGAIEAVGQGTLPFTGFPLWIAAVAAAALIATGLVLRQHGRATV